MDRQQGRQLAMLSEARRTLAEARTLDDFSSIREKAEAVRYACKVAGCAVELVNEAAEIKLRAERAAGRMLAEMPKQKPGVYKQIKRDQLDPVCPTIAELGVTKGSASRWRTIANLDEVVFERYIADAKESCREMTTAGVVKLAKREAAATSVYPTMHGQLAVGHEIATSLSDLHGRRFGCIYADPPWQYGNQGTRAATDNHYQTMSVAELCQMPIGDLAADDAHLHLWTTNAFLFDSKRVLEAWGFEYRSCFVWVKSQIGIGNYWRVSHEFLLLGVRASSKMPVFRDKNLKSWGEWPRGRHSSKPDQMRDLIERASPGPYLELFGRKSACGWTVFGNQVERMLVA